MREPTQAAFDMARSRRAEGASVAVSPIALARIPVVARRLRAHLLLGLSDAIVIALSYAVLAVTWRGDGARPWDSHALLALVIAAVVVHIVSLHAFRLYGRIWRYAGSREARDLVLSSMVAVALLLATHVVRRMGPATDMPTAVVLCGGLFATLGVGALRFRARLVGPYRRAERPRMRVAIIGSRDAAASAVRDMLSHPGAGLIPVAAFDDDSCAHGLSLLGVPVVGPVAAISGSKAKYAFDQVLLAIPSPSPTLIHESLIAAERAGVPMRLLPGVSSVVGPPHGCPSHRPRAFGPEDLLGRSPIDTDLEAVRRSLAPHTVLVTGAGGSIGSEMTRQLARFGPARLVLLDRDETHLHDAASDVSGPVVQELVDIRDADAVFDVFERHRPSVVFHAAAHKHVPILEAHPIEAARTNVFGTRNLIEASAAYDTHRFVMISTDKAVHPTSVMGATKLIGERMLMARATSTTTFTAVRFGNVLGSRGSVMPTFARQIAAGGPVTVTDPLMTRFFMTVEEAAQLVLQASLLASGGDVFMLEMGEPVSILELAKRMIRLSGYGVGTEIDIEFVGGRPGERLSEELWTVDEECRPTVHPSIVRLAPSAIDGEILHKGLLELEEAVDLRRSTKVRGQLFALAGPAPPSVGRRPMAVTV